MSDIKISLDSSGDAGAVSVVRVDGVIDTMTSTELEKVMNSLLEQGKYRIVVDLGGVDYISSAGWGIFISNIREIRQNSGDIKLARMIPNVYEIFELLEFDSILRAFDSIEKAKADFAGTRSESLLGGSQAAMPQEVQSRVRRQGQAGAAVPRTASATEAVATAGGPPATGQGEISVASTETRPAPRDLAGAVLEMVEKDPFFSIAEINQEVSRKNPGLKAGWWRIWRILRKNGLLSKKSRYRRARNRSSDR